MFFFSFSFLFCTSWLDPSLPIPIRILPPSGTATPSSESTLFPYQKSRCRSLPPFADLHHLPHHPPYYSTLEILDESPANSVSALIVAPPSADAFRRAHRHSIPGHRLNNYLKFLHELKSTTAQLFSTAVISGSSSAPNLQDARCMPRNGANLGEFLTSNSLIFCIFHHG